MNSNFKHFIGALAILITVLCAMIFSQERILRTGQTLILKTAPVDPRDAFRGDYVILSYEVTAQARRQIGRNSTYKVGDPVYITLNTDVSPATFLGVEQTRPRKSLYLTGRVTHKTNNFSPRISFPKLSQYYVPEGQGRPLEAIRRGGLFVEISVKDGEARIVNLRDKDMNIIDVSKLTTQ